jgi:hypothetical protein
MPPAGLEPATPATKRPRTYALDRSATGIGTAGEWYHSIKILSIMIWSKFSKRS